MLKKLLHFKAFRGLFVLLPLVIVLSGCQSPSTSSYEIPRGISDAEVAGQAAVEFRHGPFSDKERDIMKRVGVHAAPLQTDKIIFEVVKDNEGSSASSESYDDGVTILITFQEEDFVRMTPEMIAFVVAHELGHWDDQIRFSARSAHELEYACDFWALLSLEELGNINLYNAIAFFKLFDYPEFPSHPSSDNRYKKLYNKIKEWEGYDKKHPGRVE